MLIPLLAIALGGGAVIALAAWAGVQAIGDEVWRAAWVIAPAAGLMIFQVHASALAWRISVGRTAAGVDAKGRGRPLASRYFRIRLMREAVNSLLPVAQLGGNILGVRLLVQRGVPLATATAGTTLDITIEVVTQFFYTAAGFTVLGLTGPPAGAPWVIGTLGVMGVCVGGFIAAQRFGLMRIVEALMRPLSRVFPGLTLEAARGLHAELMRLQRDTPALLAAGAWHLAAWVSGVAETWMALWAMGHGDSLAAAFVIESLGMAARSAGFAVPGALGVQEGGFVLVAGLYGIPADAAVALSMVKRAREVLVGVPGLVMWQWAEGRRLLRRH
ncbi:MAG: lysylphosphatidylglycerol synthase domain-containing protein [Alphaproteobacteria bacterium]|nr:lysylphosphatidylglycerol synthase domain-containing protein [Alphaproteobacteria bacterium]